MRSITLFVWLFAALTAVGELLHIEADGVTEAGGLPKYARMLPRTGSDGRLAASLLPPVADWASQPIARLYYISASAPTQGNGSPQYPFNTLTYALSHMTARSALLMAPGAYDGSGTITAGNTVTLFGVGAQPTISSLVVTALGSSSGTTLDLCGLRISTLQVEGGSITIKLSNTIVSQLTGAATSVTVMRMDMGAQVTAAAFAYTDVYLGYQTAPEAQCIVDTATGRQLKLSGDRGVVVSGGTSKELAYRSDITAATDGIYGVLDGFTATDTELADLIASERTARLSADRALSNRFDSVVAALTADFGTLGGTWGTQVSTIGGRLDTLDQGLSSLRTLEASDIAEVRNMVNQTRTDYAAADSTLNTSLRNLVTTEVATLRSEVPGLVDVRAAAVAATQIAAVTNTVTATAVSMATAKINEAQTALNNSITTVDNRVTTLTSTVSGHTTSINSLKSADINLGNRVAALERGNYATAIASLNTTTSSLTSNVNTLNSWKTTTTSDIEAIKSRINDVIDCLSAIISKASLSDITVPTKF